MTARRNVIRVVIPDSHGAHIDPEAAQGFLRDLKMLDPDEIVMLGDHTDCGGVFSVHQRSYTKELTESYEDDCAAGNAFLDRIQSAAPRAAIDYIEGNHEAHLERWASRTFESARDARLVLERLAPAAMLDLRGRGIRYWTSSELHHGLSIPGTIRKGKCYYTHGISAARHAAWTHLSRFGASVCFGHTHRTQSCVERTVTSDGHGAWSFGCLSRLQPLYMHTAPTDWSHGFGVQMVDLRSGRFVTWQVPLFRHGESMLRATIDTLKKRRAP